MFENNIENAFNNGDIIYDLNCNENIYPVLTEHLSEIIDQWVNTYPEIKERLSDWKKMSINSELDPSKPINSLNESIFRDKKVLSVSLKMYPTSSPETINCSEICIE